MGAELPQTPRSSPGGRNLNAIISRPAITAMIKRESDEDGNQKYEADWRAWWSAHSLLLFYCRTGCFRARDMRSIGIFSCSVKESRGQTSSLPWRRMALDKESATHYVRLDT